MLEHERSVGGKHEPIGECFFLLLEPFPECFTTEQSTVKASSFMIKNKSFSSKIRPYFQACAPYSELRCRQHSALDSDKACCFGLIRALIRIFKITWLANKTKVCQNIKQLESGS